MNICGNRSYRLAVYIKNKVPPSVSTCVCVCVCGRTFLIVFDLIKKKNKNEESLGE